MWTPQMADAYWAEVAKEAKGDERKALACADPHRLTVQSRIEAEYAPPAEPDPELQQVWLACLEWLPPVDRQTLELGYQSSLGGLPIGRAGAGMHLADQLGIHQTTWVHRMHIAEARLTVLAPLCRAGHTLAAVTRRVDQEPLRGATVTHSALVRAYGQTWSTKGAAALLGMSQSTVHKRVSRLAETEPVLQAIHSTKKLK